jgi:anaerobic magnesium-protoporphyrin IX monomethyl ester cyclase
MGNYQGKKILLIEPPFYRLYKDTYSLNILPLSLGYLGSSIKKNTDWDVLLYNSDFNPVSESYSLKYLTGEGFVKYKNNLNDLSSSIWGEIKRIIVECNPGVVGISAKTQNFKSACHVAKIVKSINNEIIVIMGGPHPSMVGSDILKYPEIDICVIGEGEITIIEILNAIQGKKKYDDISGIAFRKNNSIITNKKRDLIADLDILDFPLKYAPEILHNFESYPASAFGHVFTARGCPYNCTFCGSKYIWTRNVRFRSLDNIIEEIKVIQKYGVNYIRFEDDSFGINKKHLIGLCDALSRNCTGLTWECEMPVQLVDEQNISLMKSSGCVLIQVGVESGNDYILSVIKKNITIEKAFSACSLIKKHRIKVSVFFMVGFPQETEETLADTVYAIKKIKCDSVVYSIYTPYPGTETYDLCRDMGLIDSDHDYSLYNHQSPENYFCINIPHDRFREIASNLEREIEKKNANKILINTLSSYSLTRIRDIGFKKILQKAALRFLILIKQKMSRNRMVNK